MTGRDVEFAIQDRVMIEDARFELLFVVGPREAPRMRELQADEQVVARPASLFVRRGQNLSQLFEIGRRVVRRHQLVGIRAPVVTDGHRFASPNQFRPALAEIFPAADCQIGRLAVFRPVPAFHRQNAEAIADLEAVELIRLAQRRIRPVLKLAVELEIDADGLNVVSEIVGGFKRSDAFIIRHMRPYRATLQSRENQSLSVWVPSVMNLAVAANRGARSIAYSFFQTQKEKAGAKVLTAPGTREYDLSDDPSHPRFI